MEKMKKILKKRSEILVPLLTKLM